MAKPLLPDDLWAAIEPLLPAPPPRPYRHPGRRRIPDRQALTGILFVLRTGMSWIYLPREMGCGSGMTCWRRLRDWASAGVWRGLHEKLLAKLEYAGEIDWARAVVDSASVRSPKAGEKVGPNPTDRRKPGSKHHVIVDGQGTPLATIVTGANTPDVNMLTDLVEAIPPVRGKRGRPRHRPERVQGDRGYVSFKKRRWLKKKRIEPLIPRTYQDAHGSGLGKTRWVVERTLSWLHGMGRLRRRFDIRADIHQAWVDLAESLITWRKLQASFC
jgi:transposase